MPSIARDVHSSALDVAILLRARAGPAKNSRRETLAGYLHSNFLNNRAT